MLCVGVCLHRKRIKCPQMNVSPRVDDTEMIEGKQQQQN